MCATSGKAVTVNFDPLFYEGIINASSWLLPLSHHTCDGLVVKPAI